MRIRNVFFLWVFVLTINLISATPVSDNGKLKVSGNQLVNECGNPVQLRGVSSHGLQYYPNCHPTAAFDFAAGAMGADVYRIAMYVDENGYLSNPSSFTSTVDTMVDQIGSRGMYAIIDWHMLTPGDPNAHTNDAITFWTHEATQHKGKNYVIYEICNEPNGVNWATVKTYADTIIPKIRAIDPDTIIICGTPNWSQLGSDVVNNKLNYTNIMYTFHFYAASHATSLLTPYVNSLPIFITEWAASTSSGGGTLDTNNATNFLNIMNGSNGANPKISSTSWSFSDAPESSAMFNSGTCSGGVYDTSKLTTEGNFVRNYLLTPGKTFIPCNTSPTNTPVVNTPTRTWTNSPVPTFTSTRTIATSTPTGTATLYAGTPTQTYTSSPVPTPGLVDADCAQGQAFTLDGNLNDAMWQTGTWTSITKSVEGLAGAVSARFKVRWDLTGIKIGVDVTDPALCGSVANWYEDDAVEVYIDANNNHSTTYGTDDYQFSIRYNDATVREENGKTGAVTALTYRTANGYSAEFSIPWTSIGIAGGAGANIGFDIGVDHNETCGATRDGVLMWNGTSNNYQDTSAFGEAVMSACLTTPTFTATQTNTFTRTNTATQTGTSTRTNTATPVNTLTNTPVDTFTASPANTETATPARTLTNTPANTPSQTNTPAGTYSFTMTATKTYSGTPTNTCTFTWTATPSYSRTMTGTPTFTDTPYYSPTETPSITLTVTGTPPTSTDTSTATPTFSATTTASATPTATPTFSVTGTSSINPTATPTFSATVTSTSTPGPTFTITATDSAVDTAVATHQPSATFTCTPVPSATWTPGNAAATATPGRPGSPGIIYPDPYAPEAGDLKLQFTLDQDADSVEFLVFSKGLRLVSKVMLGAHSSGAVKAVVDKKFLSFLASGTYYYVIEYKGNGFDKRTKIGVFVIIH
jgi:hypothetical protein